MNSPDPAVRSAETGPQVLVIGYGNELRGDDAAGPKVVEAATGWQLPKLRTLTCQQLTPELAESIAGASAVVFVDASVNAEDPSVQAVRIGPLGEGVRATHSADPRWLLALAQQAFGRCPPAWLVSVPGERFGLGESLSSKAAEGVATAEEKVREICTGEGADG